MTDRDTTRRELVRDGIAAAATAALAATVPSLLDPAGARAAAGEDGAVLASVLRVEQVVVFAYQRALATGILSAPARQLLTSFLDHERAHVHALSSNVTDLGGKVPPAPKGRPAFEAELRRLRVRRSPASLRQERQYLRFLIDLETLIARHYRFAIARLQGEKPLWLAAEIMANEAQHATVLREVLSPGNVKRAVPSGFVAGTT